MEDDGQRLFRDDDDDDEIPQESVDDDDDDDEGDSVMDCDTCENSIDLLGCSIPQNKHRTLHK